MRVRSVNIVHSESDLHVLFSLVSAPDFVMGVVIDIL